MTAVTSSTTVTESSSAFDAFVLRAINVEIIRSKLHLVKLRYAQTALRAGRLSGDDAVGLLDE